ncbi:hypothetical protein [Shewanella sp. Shew256]|uniref:hypothetical protein n=1 Tax=Shewanella sp. Shew256 TaxID=1969376 RepID=UPI000B49B6D6|nr:hypothetical protein [Shewanella sp. Shew256]
MKTRLPMIIIALALQTAYSAEPVKMYLSEDELPTTCILLAPVKASENYKKIRRNSTCLAQNSYQEFLCNANLKPMNLEVIAYLKQGIHLFMVLIFSVTPATASPINAEVYMTQQMVMN